MAHRLSTAEEDVADDCGLPPQYATVEDASLQEEVEAEIKRMVPVCFEINSADAANWLVRKVVGTRVHRERVAAWAAREKRRAEQEEERLLFLFGRQLQKWTDGELSQLQIKRKSISLPGGIVGYRKVGPVLVVEDPEAVLLWAKKNCPSVVIVSEKVSKLGLNKYVQSTGEVPPHGLRIDPERESFFIR